MKNTNFKNLMALTIAAISLSACAPQGAKTIGDLSAGIASSHVNQTPESVTLISRYTGGDYRTAAYSFRFLSQDLDQTRNNWEILFEGREDFKQDYFTVNTVVDDNSFIYDLGQKSCKDIRSSYPDERKSRPLVWLGYSEASPSDLTPSKTAPVEVGHCYLTYNNDEDGRVVALFHVQSAEKSKSVTINEIEVLDVR